MKPARIAPGQFCQCGHEIVVLAKEANLRVCRGCAADAAFCSCRAVSDDEALTRLLYDVRHER